MPITNTPKRDIEEDEPANTVFPRPDGGAQPDIEEGGGPTKGRPLGNAPMSGEATRLESGVASPVSGFAQGDVDRGYKPCGSLTDAGKSDPLDPA